MEKQLRNIVVTMFILSSTLISSASILVFALRVAPPWNLIIIGSLILAITGLMYGIISSTIIHQSAYHGADYAAMIDSITGGVLVLDGNDDVYTVSDDARGYLGLPEYAIGMHKTDAVRDGELIRCIDAAKNGESNLTEYTANGVTLRVLVDPVIFNERIVGTMLLFLDMGEQLTLQRMKREFTANVSHELKTPLTSISGYAELIANGLVDQKDVPDFASRIQKEAKRMLALISDIIRLSQLDEGAEGDNEEVDVADIADECRDVLLNSAKQHSVALNIDAEPFVIKGSRSLLTELLYNLMDNGIRYNIEGGSVTVTVRKNRVSVTDTGIGIPQEHQHRVFERFYRVDKSRSKQTGGTGLGLAIVKHIAERYGGTVKLSSQLGAGTDITVEFIKRQDG